MGEYRGRGFRMHYVEEGDGPSILFAHGFVMDHTMFAPQFEDLPDSHRCIGWDMRGHGFSASPHGSWDLQDLVDDLVAFVEHVRAAPCHLVGHSIGGMLALRVALQRPELVRSLALVSTSADVEEPEKAALYRGFLDTVGANGVDDELVRATLPLFYADRFLAESPDGVWVHSKRAKEMPREAIIETLRALLGRDSIVGRLGDMEVPALVVHGEQDRAIDVRHARVLHEGITGAQLVVVPDCGHTPPLESPDAVNRALTDFLADVGS